MKTNSINFYDFNIVDLSGSITCNFTDISICGYKTLSPSTLFWKRKFYEGKPMGSDDQKLHLSNTNCHRIVLNVIEMGSWGSVHLAIQMFDTHSRGFETSLVLGLYSLRRRRLTGIGIPTVSWRQPNDRLKFIVEIPLPIRRCLVVNRGPGVVRGDREL